jgi:hypothetical protein
VTDLPADGFIEIAAAAVVEAEASRVELGRARAAEFSAAPDKFDPRALVVLGAPGLQAFASAIGIPDLGIQRLPEPTQVVPPVPSAASGWSSQEGAIIPFEGFGAGAGVVAGVVAILTISVLVWWGH